jgi:hypothetical protein
MGAEWFNQTGRGASVAEAFDSAKKKAQYDYGHAGYTGSLAEKDTFLEVREGVVLESRQAAEAVAAQYLDGRSASGDPLPRAAEVDDKWGPAGAVEYIDPEADEGQRTWLFFGWAAS